MSSTPRRTRAITLKTPIPGYPPSYLSPPPTILARPILHYSIIHLRVSAFQFTLHTNISHLIIVLRTCTGGRSLLGILIRRYLTGDHPRSGLHLLLIRLAQTALTTLLRLVPGHQLLEKARALLDPIVVLSMQLDISLPSDR